MTVTIFQVNSRKFNDYSNDQLEFVYNFQFVSLDLNWIELCASGSPLGQAYRNSG